MGAILSTVQFAYHTLKDLINEYDVLSKRISPSPGIPQLNASIPYWTIPLSPIARQGYDAPLPLHADIVIIGSGITGTSVAKALLEQDRGTEPVKIVMLDARDACSGATGRNGGHISPNVYNEYLDLKKAHGVSRAHEILRFRLAHISSLIAVAEEENLLNASQARIVEDFDAFMHPEMFRKAQRDLQSFLMDVPKDLGEGFDVIDERETIEKFQLATSILGLIVKPGASIHAYRFVTGILSNLLSRFSNFQLFTRTPCTQIIAKEDSYIISTPRGDIKAQHVIHATNAWASHLLPGMRRKIIPLRAHMSTQRPGKGLMSTRNGPETNQASAPLPWAGSRAFVFYPGNSETGYDYLTQLVPSSNPSDGTNSNLSSPSGLPTAGEFMFGGGAMLGGQSISALMDNIGISDDGSGTFEIEAYLTGRVKATWTGLLGVSADSQPWVGRVPLSVSARQEPLAHSSIPGIGSNKKLSSESTTGTNLVSPGEWICAGYSGEGMVHAWLCGRALARMILGVDTDETDPELPEPFLITEKRIKEAKVEDLMQRISN
ncbi:hypothetical protein M413DRAFT_444955 [Hebeloma cylindrosporum]|uniref:FAD dependent oxidoreductase domain-containing protein n=1 Tax=Hebeloma cylindrosporum TaxID=76867 RepID=A0A0C2YL20_HEBCY|nr:hypothetical protein M413DRAFT_444955 [Hebeloma cylindrosporum h7]